ncbi:MAG: hypothetical protein HFF50_04390 [Lawsonibacter sp.]|nr:hypothetical protein [Lawsonibacter sp.]
MTSIEIARKLAELGQEKDACTAYTLAIHEGAGQEPAVEMEAALYILQNGGDYKVAYSTFVDLHRRGCFPEDCLSVMTHAFYQPNIKLLKTRYQNNCKLLEKYPYLFRKDFLDFEFLPIRFYPYDDNRFTPFFQERFGDFVDLKKPVVSRNFFHDLENPILAKDVYSQYELEYLNDNVRKSEYVAKENHIYLHYTSWVEFCSYLQCLNLRPLLEDEKFVFLIEDEEEQYPINFQERFGISYAHHSVKPVGIREVNRLIWHTQLSSGNGGDFFNEIFDVHPNLLMVSSLMFDNVKENVENVRKIMDKARSTREAVQLLPEWDARIVEELYLLWDRTEKDILVAWFLQHAEDHERKYAPYLDRAARIAPALFFQPHFSNMIYQLHVDSKGRTMLESEQYESVRTSPLFRNFKYIKTFTPLRRFTTSYGRTVRFMSKQLEEHMAKAEAEPKSAKTAVVIPDVVSQRVLNRSFMIDWQDRLYADSVLVRFEDGKLNPTATFTALAAFLDLPYTQTMTYCSLDGEIDPQEFAHTVRGFDLTPVYRTNDEYATDAERAYIEFFLRDAYEFYGYDFQYYDGGAMDEEKVKELVEGFTILNGWMRHGWRTVYENNVVKVEGATDGESVQCSIQEQLVEQQIKNTDENRMKNSRVLLRGLRFINRNGQPLHMMPKLELDPALLEQPLYH